MLEEAGSLRNLTLTSAGLYCPAGDFYIDPVRAVHRAVITHAHLDHARRGSNQYFATCSSLPILRQRISGSPRIEPLDYGEHRNLESARVSLHPAGHVLGSAQVRIETSLGVTVVSGDYKLDSDPTCAPFESVECDEFISECTFGDPRFVWPDVDGVFAEINSWWRANQRARRASILYCYAFGKAQRILAGVDHSAGPVVCDEAISELNEVYRSAGVPLPEFERISDQGDRRDWSECLILAAPARIHSGWQSRFGEASRAFASGWMLDPDQVATRRVDRGFVLSDHADWPGLNDAITRSAASHVFLTHGRTELMVEHLRELGVRAARLTSEWGPS